MRFRGGANRKGSAACSTNAARAWTDWMVLEGGPAVCFLIASGGKLALTGPRGHEAHPDVHGLWDGEDSLMGVVLTKYKVMDIASWQDLPASCQAIGVHAQNQVKGQLSGFVVYNSLCFGLPQSLVRSVWQPPTS